MTGPSTDNTDTYSETEKEARREAALEFALDAPTSRIAYPEAAQGVESVEEYLLRPCAERG